MKPRLSLSSLRARSSSCRSGQPRYCSRAGPARFCNGSVSRAVDDLGNPNGRTTMKLWTMLVVTLGAAGKFQSPIAKAQNSARPWRRLTRKAGVSRPAHEAVHHPLLAGLVERDGELIALDPDHVAVAEFLVKHAIADRKGRDRPGRFRHQLALDGERRAHRPLRDARRGLHAVRRRRGVLVEVVLGRVVELPAPAARLGALPARRRIGRAEALHLVEARGGVAREAAAESGFRLLR